MTSRFSGPRLHVGCLKHMLFIIASSMFSHIIFQFLAKTPPVFSEKWRNRPSQRWGSVWIAFQPWIPSWDVLFLFYYFVTIIFSGVFRSWGSMSSFKGCFQSQLQVPSQCTQRGLLQRKPTFTSESCAEDGCGLAVATKVDPFGMYNGDSWYYMIYYYKSIKSTHLCLIYRPFYENVSYVRNTSHITYMKNKEIQ